MNEVRDRLLARARALADEKNVKFFREWLKDPLGVAAVSPSSKDLADKMLAQMPEGAARVIELGGGTGVLTQAILDHGISSEHLLVLELNQTLHQHLSLRFPDARVLLGDAREVDVLAARVGFTDDGPVDAVISGLGILSMSRALQRSILHSAFNTLGPEGRFIQFTYGPMLPIAREVMSDLNLISHRAGFALRNLPPATVYSITRGRSKRFHATRVTR